MATLAQVLLWGTRIGVVSLEDGERIAAFQYEPDFVSHGIEVCPLVLPLGNRVYQFAGLSESTFRGLPGLLADSLPDRFGRALIEAWLATQGRTWDSFNVIEQLCYLGSRGMGALEFLPATRETGKAERIDVSQLVKLASEILSARGTLRQSFAADERKAALAQILQVGTSAGGARAKAVIAWNPTTNEVRSGQLATPEGFEHWLLKFDGVSGNRDKENEDPKGYTRIEFAYSLMAGAAGIHMNECRLLADGPRQHFMTRRFDRPGGEAKLHMLSLGGIAHMDFNEPAANTYEQTFDVLHQLTLGTDAAEQLYRRMLLNVIGRNQDDHVKNIAFLMDQSGQWRLSPAYDVTYSYNPKGAWTGQHQMSINGKRDGFTRDDLYQCARRARISRQAATRAFDEVRASAQRWPDWARDAGISEEHQKQIQIALRLEIPEK
jgi:serine/threonine-protein kinase HipA